MNKTELNIVLSTEPPRTTTAATNVIHSHIPVPRITNAQAKPQEQRCSPIRRGSFEKLGRTTSVAAQKANFEKLDASVQLRSKHSNLSTSSIEMRNVEEKSNPVNPFKKNDYTFPKLNGNGNSNTNNCFLENKWKSKYEESEKRRKLLLQKSETGWLKYIFFLFI